MSNGAPRRLLKWKVKNRFDSHEPIIRMSWNKQNLENLLRLKFLPDLSRLTVYQQKWKAKKYLRGYHVPNITETQFLDRHFKTALPVKLHSKDEKEKLPPMQSIMFGELERRVDVVVFRSCFASSIWNARQMVVHGHVQVNGEQCCFPARRLDDGDMVTVSPFTIPTLTHPNVLVEEKKNEEKNSEKEEEKSGKEPEEGTHHKLEKEEEKSGKEPEEGTHQKLEKANLENEKEDSNTLPIVNDPSRSRIWKPLEYMSPWMFVPKYLEVDFATCSSIFLRTPLVQPGLMEIPSPYPPSWHQLVYEWYSKKKRAQKKLPLKPALVINGQTVKLKPKFDSIMRADMQKIQERKRKERSEKLIFDKETARMRSKAEGHRAADWDMNSFLFAGRLRVISVGDKCHLHIEDANSGELFAKAPIEADGTGCEPVTDSSRYFVVKIVDPSTGKHAFVGLGFQERSYAFDLNVAIQDYIKRLTFGSMQQVEASSQPTVDYSLKDGQKFTINFGKLGQNSTLQNQSQSDYQDNDLSKFMIPAPPPSGSIQPTSFASDPARMNGETGLKKVSSNAAGNWDDFGDFTGPVSSNSSNNTQSSKPSRWTTF